MALFPDVKYLLEKEKKKKKKSKKKAFVGCDSQCWRAGNSKSKQERRLQGRARRALRTHTSPVGVGGLRAAPVGYGQPWDGGGELILGTEMWGGWSSHQAKPWRLPSSFCFVFAE